MLCVLCRAGGVAASFPHGACCDFGSSGCFPATAASLCSCFSHHSVEVVVMVQVASAFPQKGLFYLNARHPPHHVFTDAVWGGGGGGRRLQTLTSDIRQAILFSHGGVHEGRGWKRHQPV